MSEKKKTKEKEKQKLDDEDIIQQVLYVMKERNDYKKEVRRLRSQLKEQKKYFDKFLDSLEWASDEYSFLLLPDSLERTVFMNTKKMIVDKWIKEETIFE